MSKYVYRVVFPYHMPYFLLVCICIYRKDDLPFVSRAYNVAGESFQEKLLCIATRKAKKTVLCIPQVDNISHRQSLLSHL